MKNIKEFKALIKRYKSITIEEIKEAKDRLEYSYDGDELASILTGFGTHSTCTLCKPLLDKVLRANCDSCVWVTKTNHTCTTAHNRKTYEKIENALSDKKSLKAFKKRAKYMEQVLSKNTD